MRKFIWIAPLTLMVLLGCGGPETSPEAGEGEDAVLATVGDFVITQSIFDAELEKIPPFQRQELTTPEGKNRFLERMVKMELLYMAADDADMEKDEDVLDELDYARRQIMMKHYYQKHIEASAVATDEQVSEYFQEHSEEFILQEKVKARMLVAADEASARSLKKRIGEGEDFLALAENENHDGSLAAEAGDLGWFTQSGYVRGVGIDANFTAAVFELAPGQISDPLDLGEKGWGLVLVEEREEGREQSLDEVRAEIERRLMPQVREEHYETRIEELREKYGVEVADDPFDLASSPEELFRLAQEASSPQERIDYYQKLVEKFGDSEQADRAQFMIGFVYSEELQDSSRATTAFERFLELYPESDLAKDADYMIKSLSGEEPELELEP
jgi:hypothetical protein